VVYLPAIDERLVAALAVEFPDRSPDLEWSDREIMFRAGQVSVVKWLAQKLEDQTANAVIIEPRMG